MFLVFATPYACILSTDNSAEENGGSRCEFSTPVVSAWRAVAIAVTRQESAIPQSSLVFSVTMAGIISAMVLLKNLLLVGRWKRVQIYQPNMMVVVLAFTSSALMGALVAHI